ncbi:hypothetical protein ACFWPV_26630 [Streptomyces uncialis]|uniref:hypothetical protein n=1 Tax=Streptomyces uncialis TaxID=1048205 RepID=UPI0036588353
MSSDRSLPVTPVTVLTRGGTTARFDGARLVVVRGRSTWTVPVRALEYVELTDDGAIRALIAGSADSADHGLGPVVDLRGPNRSAAEAFFGQLSSAVDRTPSAADGHALVRHQVRAAGRAPLSPAWRKGLTAAGLILLHHTALTVFGLIAVRDPGLVLFTVVTTGTLGLAGGLVLWRVGRRFRALWLLRRRGIGVVGEAVGHVRIWSKGGHWWEFSRMDFVTVDGRRMKGVPSVVTVWSFSDASRGRVELSYDPENPERASRPLTAGFCLRTLILAAPGVALFSGYVVTFAVFLEV